MPRSALSGSPAEVEVRVDTSGRIDSATLAIESNARNLGVPLEYRTSIPLAGCWAGPPAWPEG